MNPIFASLGGSIKLDWQFEYTQPLDYIVWQKISALEGPTTNTRDTPRHKAVIGTLLVNRDDPTKPKMKFLPKGL